jgi:hypothetical protein
MAENTTAKGESVASSGQGKIFLQFFINPTIATLHVTMTT